MNVETRKTLLGLWFLFIIMFGRFPKLDRWANIVWYSVVHDVPSEHLLYSPEPSDCDFMHAPIGFKGCSYKKVVSIEENKSGKFATIVWSKEVE